LFKVYIWHKSIFKSQYWLSDGTQSDKWAISIFLIGIAQNLRLQMAKLIFHKEDILVGFRGEKTYSKFGKKNRPEAG